MKKHVYEEAQERMAALEVERDNVYEAMRLQGFSEALQRRINNITIKMQVQKDIMEREKWRGVRSTEDRGYLPAGIKIHINI